MGHRTGARRSAVRPLPRAAAWGLGILVALVAVPAERAHAVATPWIASEEMLVELRAGRLAQRTVLARRVRGEVLLPCGPLFDLLEMDASIDELGRLDVSGGRGWRRIRIDPAGPDAFAGERPVNPDDLTVEWNGTELYVGAGAVGDLLSTRVQIDLQDLTVTLENVDHLPVGRRVARERAREAWLSRQGIRPAEVTLGPDPTVIRGGALTWGVSAPIRRPEGAPAGDYRLGLGAGFVGGSLDVDYDSAGRDGNEGRWTGAWMRAWPESRYLRQARLGTIVGTGPHARSLRGFAFSNTPYQRLAYFGETSVVGRVPPGWEVEIWQEGHPVGFVRADERGLFDAPVGVEYGTNVLEIRAYGERGEEAWLSRAVQVDAERLPEGTVEYQASWGDCESGPCSTQGNLDLRWGVRDALTVRAGADWFTREADPTLFHPYTELVGSWRQEWLARFEGVANAFGAIELGYHPTQDLRVTAIHTAYDRDVVDPVLTPRDVDSRSQVSVFWRPDDAAHSRFLDSSFGRTEAVRWRQSRARLGYHDRVGRVRWSADWQEVRTSGELRSQQSLLGLAASASLSRGRGSLLNRFHTRGFLEVDVRDGALSSGGFSLGRSLGRVGRVELSVEWYSGEDAPLLGFNMSTDGYGFRSSAQVMRSPAGVYSGRTEAEGALVWNEAAGRVEATSLVGLGRGGISGSAFLDDNGNGVRDRNEKPLAGVRIEAGDRTVRTNADGRYAIWDLPAFEPATVSVDVTSADNPLLTSAFTRASVPVRPNGYREVDVPLVAGVEVSGRILRVDDTGTALPLGGVPVSLRHVVSGREHSTRTFHDGVFYLVSVPPGDYEVTVDRDWLERANLRTEHPERRYLLRASREGASTIDVLLVPEGRR